MGGCYNHCMRHLFALSFVTLITVQTACTAGQQDLAACESGVRNEYLSTIETPGGAIPMSATQCVRLGWGELPCDDPEHCFAFFEPEIPPTLPHEAIFDDFVFYQQIGHVDTFQPPPMDLGFNEIFPAMESISDIRVIEGWLPSQIQSYQINGHPAFEVGISCEHPDTNPMCPFTFYYTLVDLGAIQDGLVASLTAEYAAYADVGNFSNPPEYEEYKEMVMSFTAESQ